MGASIRGFRGSIRPVVAVDGTFRKGKYLGTLFVAVCHDGKNKIYHLAFGVGDSENDASWTWFLTKLRTVQIVFPKAYHGACMYHLYYTTKAYLVSEFNSVMTDIWAIKDGKVGKYLQEIGYHRWARAHFSGKRYNMMTTNIAESMNAKLKDARKLPIIALTDHLRSILQEWFNERQNTASSWNSTLTKWAEEKVHKNQNRGLRMSVSSINHHSLQVHEVDLYHIVDLNAKSCTCKRFDLDQLPCVHATAAFNAIVLAYAEPIWPVRNKSEWSVSEEVQNRVVLPPIRQVGEERIVKKCSRCGGTGHNRQTWMNPIRLHSNT
ncbi:unnamed protein product [Malus baccata var. baccata]